MDPDSSDTSRNSDDDYGVPELVDFEEEDSVDSTHDESEVRTRQSLITGLNQAINE